MLRVLRVARTSAVKAKTSALLNMRDLLITAPAELRERLRGLSAKQLVAHCAGWEQPVRMADPATPWGWP